MSASGFALALVSVITVVMTVATIGTAITQMNVIV